MSSPDQSIHSEDEREIDLDRDEPTNEVHEGSDDENKDKDDNAEKRVVKPKRVIKNPRPKLNTEVLKGPKGLCCLENYFQNVKTKGTPGNEAEDLRLIMKTYEYWCHRLFPKYTFDECITKIEKLGSKKDMQTYLKKIRLGMEDFGFSKPQISDDDDEEIDQKDNSPFNSLPINSNQTQSVSVTPQLTEEQLERMRINKERAERIRKEKLKKMQEKAEMCISKINLEEINSTIAQSQEVGECSQELGINIGCNKEGDDVNISMECE